MKMGLKRGFWRVEKQIQISCTVAGKLLHGLLECALFSLGQVLEIRGEARGLLCTSHVALQKVSNSSIGILAIFGKRRVGFVIEAFDRMSRFTTREIIQIWEGMI